MQRYFLHIKDGRTVRDEEGQEFEGLEQATAEAIASARSIMRDAIWAGRLPLDECIEITDAHGTVLASIPFRDAITIQE